MLAGLVQNRKSLLTGGFFSLFRAGNETRTRDPNLGKVVLYQLSYSRVAIDLGIVGSCLPSVNNSVPFWREKAGKAARK